MFKGFSIYRILIKYLVLLSVSLFQSCLNGLGTEKNNSDLISVGHKTVEPDLSCQSLKNKQYKIGDEIKIGLSLSNKSLNVAGQPKFSAKLDSGSRDFLYSSGSGTKTIYFHYLVQEGDRESNFQLPVKINKNGGSIQFDGKDTTKKILCSSSTMNNIKIDGIKPAVQNITLLETGNLATGEEVLFDLEFNESVELTGIPTIELTFDSGAVFANYDSQPTVDKLRFKYEVTSSNLDTNGIFLSSNLNLNGGTLKDQVGNNALLDLPAIDSSNVFINAGAYLTITAQTTNNYGVIPVGQQSNLYFDLTNTHPTATVTAISINLKGEFSFTGGSFPGAGGDCSNTLAGSSTCTIDVTFTPTMDSSVNEVFELSYFNGYENETENQNLLAEAISPPNSVILITPSNSLSNIQTPQIQINGIRNPSTIKVYTDADCLVLHDTFSASATSLSETLSPLAEGNQDLFFIQNYLGVDSECSSSLLNYTVDITPPSAPSGLTLSGGATSTQSENVSWTASSDLNGISHYLYAIGTSAGAEDILPFTNIGNVLTYQDMSLTYSLINYYTSIKAVDLAGNISAALTSPAWTLDTTPPNPPTALIMVKDFFSGSLPATTAVFSWTNPTLDFYHTEVALGSTPGGNEIKDWVQSTNVSDDQFSDVIGISECTTLYPSARAIDHAGNISTVVTYAGDLKWDNTPPSTPANLTITSDESYPHQSIHVSWDAAVETCGNVSYEVSLSTTAGAHDIQGWIDIGASLNYQVKDGVDGASFTLLSNTNYYVNIRAVDSAGNISTGILSSTPFQIQAPYAHLTGNETTAPSSPSNLAQATAYEIKWDSSSLIENYFDHSTTLNSHEVKVLKNGNYLLDLTVPLTGIGQRVGIINQIYVNGTQLDTGMASTTYIRNSSAHNSASNHLSLLLPNLTANDIITIKSVRNTTINGTASTDIQAHLKIEFLDSNRNLLYATSTTATLGDNLNLVTPTSFQFNHQQISSSYSHNNSTNTEQIQVTEAGFYKLSFNLATQTTCTNLRNALVVDLVINDVVYDGASAAQGYTRCSSAHDFTTYHLNSVVSFNTNDIIKIQAKQDAASQVMNFFPGTKASLILEKISAADLISLSGTNLVAGSNWNVTGGSPIQWDQMITKDATTFSHSISTDNHEITILDDGNYTLLYNDFLASTSTRTNVQIRVKVNGAVVDFGKCSTHYIRNSDGHNNSSCTLNLFLESLLANDVITIEALREANSGTATAEKALLSLIKN